MDFYHAAFVSKQALSKENEEIRISLIQKELSNCLRQLSRREIELQERLTLLEKEAVARKNAKDMAGIFHKLNLYLFYHHCDHLFGHCHIYTLF